MIKRVNNNGFSLIELLGVIVILGIVSVACIVAYSKYHSRAVRQSYSMMSQDASDAAINYFMDNPLLTEVSLETLVNEDYLENAIDPVSKKEICTGTVTRVEINRGNMETLDDESLKVNIECGTHSSCMIYPNHTECD